MRKYLDLQDGEEVPEKVLYDFRAGHNTKAKQLLGMARDKDGKVSIYNSKRHMYLARCPYKISAACCGVMKKKPAHDYTKKEQRYPMTAQMASESRLRTEKWLQNGCNGFDLKLPVSNPMSFWTESDVLCYIYKHNIRIAPVYGQVVKDTEVEGQYDFEDLGIFDLGMPVLKTTGLHRTGCVFCGYGCHLEKKGDGRFVKLKKTHPSLYNYLMKPWSEGGLGYKEVIDWLNENGNLHIEY